MISKNWFKNVYGKYDYFLNTDTNKHIVIVVDNKNYKLLAIFLINGDVSINFLLGQNDVLFGRDRNYKINFTRKKAQTEKTSFIYEEELIQKIDMLIARINGVYGEDRDILGIIRVDINLIKTTLSHQGYYYSDRMTTDEKQLILLGNKTIGDLIFSSDIYKNQIYSISTTDSFVWESVLYNYLSGNSNILQSVWEKDSGGGWIYTEGIFSETIESRVKYLLVQIASVLSFSKYISNSDFIWRDLGYVPTISCRSILYLLGINDDRKLGHILNIVLEKLPLIRVDNCLKSIFSLYHFYNSAMPGEGDEILNENFESSYVHLSHNIFKKEIFYKYELIRNYIKQLLEIVRTLESTDETSLNTSLDKLKLLTKLSNMFYMNTVSIYRNNKSTIKTLPTVILPSSRMSDEQTFNIFNVDPNLDKIITKEKIPKFDGSGMAIREIININILKKRDLVPDTVPDTVAKLLLNIYSMGGSSYFNIVPNVETISDAYGYSFPENPSVPDTTTTISFDGNDRSSRDIFLNNYMIEKTVNEFDNGIYYKLINNTLNRSELEFLLFTNNPINNLPTKQGTPKAKTKILGKIMISDEGRRKKYIHITLWKASNTIANLFYLLNFKSIRDDTFSTTLIITKILKHFKYSMMNSKLNNESENDINSQLFGTINNMRSFKNIIIENLAKIVGMPISDTVYTLNNFNGVYMSSNVGEVSEEDDEEDGEEDSKEDSKEDS